VLPGAVAPKGLQGIAWWKPQVSQGLAAPYSTRLAPPEASNHGVTITRAVIVVKTPNMDRTWAMAGLSTYRASGAPAGSAGRRR
jgi:hypothetical protein